MNRNHQNRNTLNHTSRGRHHIARRQLGPGFQTPLSANPSEERNIRYSTAPFWSEKTYPYDDESKMFEGRNDFYAPEFSESSNYRNSNIHPVEIMAKESLRHGHDFTHFHDHHGQEFSYRAKTQMADLGEEDFIHSYAGVGPKDYKRSDSFIEEEVCERLKGDKYIDAGDITVSVQDGVVRMFGTVPNRKHKFAIEDVVEEVRGVIGVQNDIRVQKVFISGFTS